METMTTMTTMTCRDCNGSGESRNGSDLNCEHCGGSGRVETYNARQERELGRTAPDAGEEWSEPYYIRGQGWLIADKSGCIAQVRNQAIAAQIVAEHNAVGLLVAALEAARKYIDAGYQPPELVEQINAALAAAGRRS
jgi:hypothetical protein